MAVELLGECRAHGAEPQGAASRAAQVGARVGGRKWEQRMGPEEGGQGIGARTGQRQS